VDVPAEWLCGKRGYSIAGFGQLHAKLTPIQLMKSPDTKIVLFNIDQIYLYCVHRGRCETRYTMFNDPLKITRETLPTCVNYTLLVNSKNVKIGGQLNFEKIDLRVRYTVLC
jgi:hypothetical protein